MKTIVTVIHPNNQTSANNLGGAINKLFDEAQNNDKPNQLLATASSSSTHANRSNLISNIVAAKPDLVVFLSGPGGSITMEEVFSILSNSDNLEFPMVYSHQFGEKPQLTVNPDRNSVITDMDEELLAQTIYNAIELETFYLLEDQRIPAGITNTQIR